jgi:hypothetical protein
MSMDCGLRQSKCHIAQAWAASKCEANAKDPTKKSNHKTLTLWDLKNPDNKSWRRMFDPLDLQTGNDFKEPYQDPTKTLPNSEMP